MMLLRKYFTHHCTVISRVPICRLGVLAWMHWLRNSYQCSVAPAVEYLHVQASEFSRVLRPSHPNVRCLQCANDKLWGEKVWYEANLSFTLMPQAEIDDRFCLDWVG